MSKKEKILIAFLEEVMRRRRRLPSQMAVDLGISHATVSRWLSGKDVPSPRSCRSLAAYSGVSIDKVLAVAGHISQRPERSTAEWPEFREYVRIKYPDELDEDVIIMIEDLIERRRAKRYEKRKRRVGK